MTAYSSSTSLQKLIGLISILIVPCSCAYISVVTSNGKDATTLLRYISSRQAILYMLKALLLFWLLIEFTFYGYFLYTLNRLQQVTKPEKSLSKQQRTTLFWNCMNTIKDIDRWCTGWFYYKTDYTHPTLPEIKRDNLALWFAWAFWHENLDTVRQNKAWKDEMEWMLSSAESWFQIKFPEGLNTDLQCIRLNLDPVQAIHRPFILYVGLYLITTFFNTFFLEFLWGYTHCGATTTAGVAWGGFLSCIDHVYQSFSSFFKKTPTHLFNNHKPLKHISYWHLDDTTTSKKEKNKTVPLVFIHGIGVGLMCYAEFVHQLSHLNRPVFLVELPYVAMHMVDQVPTASQTVLEIKAMLSAHGYEKAVYISHSLGTGVTSWIMNMAPETVAGTVLIDPICFLLHYHHVAFNFVHRKPKTVFEYILYYGASRELYISNYISRHFQWFETIYFTRPCAQTLEKGPLENATVYLSEKDGIVGSACVYDYLLEKCVDVRMMEGLDHAMFLAKKDWKSAICDQINSIAQKADKKIK